MPDLVRSIEEFRRGRIEAAKGEPIRGEQTEPGAHVRTSFDDSEVKASAENPRLLTFTISSESVDRMGDTIAVDGWQLDAYKRNPVVLWSHDSGGLPVAKSPRVWKERPKLRAETLFTSPGLSAFNDTVLEMYKGGFLSATSVGFVPLKYAFTDDPKRRFGIDFLEQELLEFSLVPVPANAEALIEGKAAGIDIGPMLDWAQGVVRRSRFLKGVMEDTGAAMESLRQAIALHQGHMDGTVPTDEESQRQLMDLMAAAFGSLTDEEMEMDGKAIAQLIARANDPSWKCSAARNLPIDESDAWDGPAAAKRMLDAAGFDGDNPDASKARRGFLAWDSANPGLRTSYKLPFADIVAGRLEAVGGGLRASASRLPQTDIPQDVKDEARSVLDGYFAKLEPADGKSILERAEDALRSSGDAERIIKLADSVLGGNGSDMVALAWAERIITASGKAIVPRERIERIERAARQARLAQNRKREIDVIRARGN